MAWLKINRSPVMIPDFSSSRVRFFFANDMVYDT
jgi:hypothetical protein